MDDKAADDELTRIRMEFVEMPDLKLTIQQACRLWNLSDGRCGRAFNVLLERQFLMQTSTGAFIRRG